MKTRLDQRVVDEGMAESREQAKRLILAGSILNQHGEALTKPGVAIDEKIPIQLKEPLKYVSRGGLKIEGFMKDLPLSIQGFCCIDIGASTGGFTDYLLQNGAVKVVCVDVGAGILHWKIRNDSRVKVLEKMNARSLPPETTGDSFDLGVMDLSFISLKLVLPAVIPLIRKDGYLITLVKPQFEAGREHVAKGGVVKSEEIQQQCVDQIRQFGTEHGLKALKEAPCCIKGPAGNQEYFIFFQKA